MREIALIGYQIQTNSDNVPEIFLETVLYAQCQNSIITIPDVQETKIFVDQLLKQTTPCKKRSHLYTLPLKYGNKRY